MIIYMAEDILRKNQQKEFYKEVEINILMKTWECNIYDGKIKINHNPEINKKQNRSEKHTKNLQIK